MKNKLLLSGMLVVLLVFGFVLAGCASVPWTSSYSDGRKPIQVISEVNQNSVKSHQLSSKVWLGYFGETAYPAIADVAKAGNITRIATVEYYWKLGILSLWKEYTTIVTGE